MNKAVKSIILGSLSLSLLAGCSDDKKGDPIGVDGVEGVPGIDGESNGKPGVPGMDGTPGGRPGQDGVDGEEGSVGSQYIAYGIGSSLHSLLQATDAAGTTVDVDADGSAELTNATITPLNTPYNDDGVNVITREGKDFTISSSTINGQARDLQNAADDGTLQFDIKVNTLNNKGSHIDLTMSSDSLGASPSSTVHEANVRISSAIHASTGAETQTLSIPLSCFTGQGIDFSKSLTQFAMTNTRDINYDLSNIRLMSDSLNQRKDLPCEPIGDVLLQNDDVIFTAIGEDGQIVEEGWALASGAWGSAKPKLDFPQAWRRLTFLDSAEAGQHGGLAITLRRNEQPKDLSRYIEKGALEILLEVENYAEHPTQILNVRMESPAGHSKTYSLPEGFANNVQGRYTIPLTELFSQDEDGQMNHLAIQSINKALVVEPQRVPDHSLRNMKYKVGEVKLIWEYDAPES